MCALICPIVCSSSGDLDVRLGFSLCLEERDFLRKRKKYVAAALKKILNLEEDLKEHEASQYSPWQQLLSGDQGLAHKFKQQIKSQLN